MPRKYERKTTRGASKDVLFKAAKDVEEGQTVRSAAKAHNVDRMTLHRFISYQKKLMQENETIDEDTSFGYERIAHTHKVFSSRMENDLALQLTALADMFYGLPQQRCRELAYEFAISNNVSIPKSWHANGTAGHEWFLGFKERHNFSLRQPEGTSLPRPTPFNESNVNDFCDKMATAIEKYRLKPQDIYNADQMNISTAQNKEPIRSAEQDELTTIVCTINAVGNSVPPLFVFPGVSFHDHFLTEAPVGSAGCAAQSGLVNENIFNEKFIPHFVEHTRCSKERPILLILNNHESYVSIRTVQIAKENGIVIVTIPPHTAHLLQPLDRSVFQSFKCNFDSAVDGWMLLGYGKVTISEIPSLVNVALQNTITPRNILAGFQSSGIYPFNRDLIKEHNFSPTEISASSVSKDASQVLNLSLNYPVRSHLESRVHSSEGQDKQTLLLTAGETENKSKVVPLDCSSEGFCASETCVSRNNESISQS